MINRSPLYYLLILARQVPSNFCSLRSQSCKDVANITHQVMPHKSARSHVAHQMVPQSAIDHVAQITHQVAPQSALYHVAQITQQMAPQSALYHVAKITHQMAPQSG